MTFIPAINYENIPFREAPKLVFSNFSKILLALPCPNNSIHNITKIPPISDVPIFSQFCMFALFFLLLFFFIQKHIIPKSIIRIIIKPKDNSDYVISIVNYMTRLPTIRNLIFNGNFYISYDQSEFIITDHIFGKFLIIDDNCVLDIFTDTLNIHHLRSFLDKIYLDDVKKDTNQYLYTPCVSNYSSFRFEKSVFKTDITFSNLFSNSIQTGIDQVRFFINNKSWYKKNAFPYTLGVLVYGPSGCGKTSIVKAIAKESGRHIITVKLNKKTTHKQLSTLFFDQHIHVYDQHTKKYKVVNIPFDERMYLFENIDHLSSKQFSFVKELLYGILETPERFVVFTADNIKAVHPSLLTAGRIDAKIYLDFCDVDTIVELVSNFYETNLENYDTYKISLKDNVLTPSSIYEILFRNITNHDNALKEISDRCYLELVDPIQTNDDLKEEITSMISDELDSEDSIETERLPNNLSDSTSSVEVKPNSKDIELVDFKQNNKKGIQTDTVCTEVKEVQTDTVETSQKEVQTNPVKKKDSLSLDDVVGCELSDSDFSETIEDENEDGLTQLQFLKGISLIESMSDKIKKNSVIVDDFFTS